MSREDPAEKSVGAANRLTWWLAGSAFLLIAVIAVWVLSQASIGSSLTLGSGTTTAPAPVVQGHETPAESRGTVVPTSSLTIEAPTLNDLEKEFPLTQGNTWIYDSLRYGGNNATDVVTTTNVLTMTVVGVRSDTPDFYAAKIHGASVDDYWLILTNNRLYKEEGNIDVSSLPIRGEVLLQFPLYEGASWYQSADLEKLYPKHDNDSMLWRVKQVAPSRILGQTFGACYDLTENIGGTNLENWFCPGVGFIEIKSDHQGTPFGSHLDLVRYNFFPSNPPPPPTPFPTATPVPPSIWRSVDWSNFITTTSELDHDESGCRCLPIRSVGPYVSIKPSGKEQPVYGYAALGDIWYQDINRDGRPEAMIWLEMQESYPYCDHHSGLLIYQMGDTGPHLLTAIGGLDGYKLNASFQDGILTVTKTIRSYFEAMWGKCIDAGTVTLSYRAQSGRLLPVAQSTTCDPASCLGIVRQFYDWLSMKEYRYAYELLSPSFQAAHPYDSWRIGYQDTISITVQTTQVETNVIAIDITAIDTSGSAIMTRHYTGTWTLALIDAYPWWVLDQPSIQSVP